MLIVITKDQEIMEWASSPESGAGAWGSLKQLSAGTQRTANPRLLEFLSGVAQDEPLCITGHGNDTEVGDEGSGRPNWTWTHADLASLLGALVDDYRGPILMEVCANTVSDFAAHLVESLERGRLLTGVWVYGYNKSISTRHPFPNPNNLARNVELYGKLVE